MVQPHEVKTVLAKHILADGLELVMDLENSSGSYLVDKLSGDRFLDFFSMYASMAVGYNHPRLLAVKDQLAQLVIQKPSCSDVYTETFAEFVATFSKLAMPAALPHVFFIEGGAPAVENALKTAFDWKVRKNFVKGAKVQKGSKIIHFQQAFHGRSGYTLSLTNTFDTRKTKFFPSLQWPRIINPKITFPINQESLEQVAELEGVAVQQINDVIAAEGDDIAGLIIEPIQGEGGDNHFRPQFLQQLRQICDQHDILYIMDEVQSGVGLTGKFWAHEHFNVRPDILCFGKKTQVCGILASRRIDEVDNNVFQESSRINSTFGGNLIDMARCAHILRIIEEENLVDKSRRQGELLLSELEKLGRDFPHMVTGARGRGLMCAFDLPEEQTRNRLLSELFKQRVLLLGAGEKTVRFRPHLIVNSNEIQQVIGIIRNILSKIQYH
ncbi:L-lysine 6-transaminase [Desulfogranum marinum]|uniref:L-lysine 6-transaminase n=1 Tax=Desulfogranum marinum TaxID=453220 RepID=UPI0029C96356|nr:L-lysine 6-transaminase [Desulfogranum marinum]